MGNVVEWPVVCRLAELWMKRIAELFKHQRPSMHIAIPDFWMDRRSLEGSCVLGSIRARSSFIVIQHQTLMFKLPGESSAGQFC